MVNNSRDFLQMIQMC